MRPGSSSVAGSTLLPCDSARVCSVPTASGSAIQAASRLSRPNSVMNHGAPAATNGRPRSFIRSTPRSLWVWRSTWPRFGSSVEITVLSSRHALILRAGRVLSRSWPGRNWGCTRRSPRVGRTTISVVQRPLGGTTMCQLNVPGNTTGFADAVTDEPRELLRRSRSKSSGPVTVTSAKVVERDRLPHAVAHQPFADHKQRAVGISLHRRLTQHEPRSERLWGEDRERVWCLSVNLQLPARDHPYVAEEQPMRGAGLDVPHRIREAERTALDQHDRSAAAGNRHRSSGIQHIRRSITGVRHGASPRFGCRFGHGGRLRASLPRSPHVVSSSPVAAGATGGCNG